MGEGAWLRWCGACPHTVVDGEGMRDQAGGWFHVTCWPYDADGQVRPEMRIRMLIERGSLGTPAAKRLRAGVDRELVNQILAQVLDQGGVEEPGRAALLPDPTAGDSRLLWVWFTPGRVLHLARPERDWDAAPGSKGWGVPLCGGMRIVFRPGAWQGGEMCPTCWGRSPDVR